MAIDKINPFNTAAMQSIKPTKAVTGQTSAEVNGGFHGATTKGSNLFSNSTSGINQSMNGQSMNTPAMAGKEAGFAGKKLNLIG